MFHDPHGKVFSVFVDVLAQFVSVYHAELTDWLYTCLTRLLTKTGVDMLASVQAKIQKTLDAIRYGTCTQGLNWGDPAGSQIRHLLFEIHYL